MERPAAVADDRAAVVAAAWRSPRRRPALAAGGARRRRAALAFCSLPFIANDRMGVLGAWINDDLPVHMGQADALPRVGRPRNYFSGVPDRPARDAAALEVGLGVSADAAFTALLLAMPALMALTASAALAGSAWYLRLPAAVLVGDRVPLRSPTSRKARSRSR